jgi:hypothetical protein
MDSTNLIDYLTLFFAFWDEEHIAFINALQRDGLLHLAFATNGRYLVEVNAILDKKLGRKSTRHETVFRSGGLVSVFSAWIANGRAESPEEMAAMIAKIVK